MICSTQEAMRPARKPGPVTPDELEGLELLAPRPASAAPRGLFGGERADVGVAAG